LEALFSKKIYFCEGLNDSIFLNKYLRDNNLYYDDYSIFVTYGKRYMPLYIQLFIDIGGYDISFIYDEDDSNNDLGFINKELNSFEVNKYCFKENIEKYFSYKINKYDINRFYDFLEKGDKLLSSIYKL